MPDKHDRLRAVRDRLGRVMEFVDMIFASPESRRALRSMVQAAVAFVLLALVWHWADRLDGDGLREAVRWALAIVALGTLGYVMENGLRALKFSAGKDGVNIEAGGDGK